MRVIITKKEEEMKRVVGLGLCLLFVVGAFSTISARGESGLFEKGDNIVVQEDGRYVLRIMHGRALTNNRIPALVLDQVRGIVWTCQNLQDGKPLWVRADLGQNGDKPLTRKKYTVKMLEWQDADLRMPAIVLDIDEGIVWTCQNIIDGRARWVQTDLKSGREKEISRSKLGIVKTE